MCAGYGGRTQKARIICDLSRPCVQCKLIGAAHMCMGYELNNHSVEQPSRGERGDGEYGLPFACASGGRDATRQKQKLGGQEEMAESAIQDRRSKVPPEEHMSAEGLLQRGVQTSAKYPYMLDVSESKNRETTPENQQSGERSELFRAQSPRRGVNSCYGGVYDGGHVGGVIGGQSQEGGEQRLHMSLTESARDVEERQKQQRGDKQRKRQKTALLEGKSYYAGGVTLDSTAPHFSGVEDRNRTDVSPECLYDVSSTLFGGKVEGGGTVEWDTSLYACGGDACSSHMGMVSRSPASALYVLDSGSHPPTSKPALGHPDGAGDFPLDDQAGLNEALVREVIRLRQDQYKIMQELNFLRDQQDQMIKSAPSLFQLQNILAQLSIGFPSTAQGGALQQQVRASARPTDVEVDDKKRAGTDASRLEVGQCADARLADGSKLNMASVDCESDGRVGLESGAAKMGSSDNARSLHPSPADGRAEEYDYLGGMSSEPSVDTVEATLNMTSPVSGPFLPEVDTPDGETQCGEPASVSSLSVFLVETGIQLAENLQSMMGDDCPIVIFDFTYNMPVIRNTNMAFLDLFGYTQDQVAKMKWRMFICPHYLERTVQILKQARSQKDTFIQFTQVYTNVYFKNFLALDTHVLLSTQRGGLVDLVIIQPDKSLPCPSIGDRSFRSFKLPLPSRLEGSELVKSDAEQSQQYARTMLSATLNIASMASRAARGIDVDPSGREESSTELPERWKSASGERQMKEGDRAEEAPSCAGDAISNPAYERLHPRGDDRGIHPSASDLVNREKDRAIEQKMAQNAASEGSSSPYYHSYQHGLGFPPAPSEKKAYPMDADQSSKFSAREFAPKTILPSSDYSSLDHHQFYAPSHPFASNHLQTAELCAREPQSQHAEPLGSSVSQMPRLELSELPNSHRPSSSSPLHRASLPSHAPTLASSVHFFQDCKQRHYSDPLLPRTPHPYEDPPFFADFGDDSSRFYDK